MLAVGPVVLLAMGATVVASAQSSSPFATKRKTQAWETPDANAPLPTPAAARSGTSGAPIQLRGARTPLPVPAQSEMRDEASPVQSSSRSSQSQAASAPAQAPIPSAKPPVASAAVPSQSSSSITGTPGPLPAQPATQSAEAPALAPATRSYPAVNPNSRWALAGSVYNNGLPQTDDTDWTIHTLPSRRGPAGYRGEVQIQSDQGSAASGSYGRQAQPPLPSRGWSEVQNQAPSQGGPYARGPSSNGSGTSGPYGNQGIPNRAGSQNRPGSYQGGPYAQGGQSGPNSGPYSGQQNGPYGQSGPYGTDGPAGGPPPRQTFWDRIGMRGVRSLFSGGIRGGVAARESGGWEEAFIGDADIEGEVSAITRNGIEWGVHGQVRAQYDEGRKGFTRRLPDCPPTLAGCPSVLVGGVLPAAVRGHTSQFYTSGPDVAKDTQIALESAHLFLRSAYGDVTLGRDDGAAYLFSLGAPSLLNVGASNSTVDYTGLDTVKTVNDASGFSEKITYTSPRLLGDQVGVGVQFGLSYSPNSDSCGVDYCVDLNEIPNVAAPHIEDVMEAGVALDRTFANGMSVEGTLTYATGSEQSGQAGFDNLKAIGTGIEVKLSDWTLGGSYLNSNQGLINGDYEAYDIGLTWKPSRLGFTVGYGHASDDLVNLSSDQWVGGVSFDINERFTVSTGVQYANRHSVRQVGATAQKGNDNATSIFIEGGFRF